MIDVSTIRQLHRNALLRAATMWLIAVGTTTAVLAGAAALTSTSTATTREAPSAVTAVTAIKANPALSVAGIEELDRVQPFGTNLQPKSNEPAGGIAFVRCTRLWRAMPDGSDPRLILDMPGISSPTFAPNARTIAFFKDGREIWMVSAEGSHPTRLGNIAVDGALPEGVRAINLSWSPDGKNLAFALVAQGGNPWTDGASIWTLGLEAGYFMQEGFGWPVPSWQGSYLTYPNTGGDRGVYQDTKDAQSDRRLALGGTPLGTAFAPEGWNGTWGRGVATIRDGGRSAGDFIGYRLSAWDKKDNHQIVPPAGFTVAPNAQPAISQDTHGVFVDLIDLAGNPTLGIFSVPAESWTLIDYAWQPDTSPAPMAIKNVGERRAEHLANDLLFQAQRGGTKLMLLRGGKGAEPALKGFKGYVNRLFGSPNKTPNGWQVPAFLFGRQEDGPFAARKVRVDIKNEEGRLEVKIGDADPVQPITTIDKALDVLDQMLPEADFVLPTLPEGTVIDERYPIQAGTWGNSYTATLQLKVPNSEGGFDDLMFSVGDVSLSFGCGGVMEPTDQDIGIDAVSDHMQKTRAIVWPGTVEDMENARYLVYGVISEDMLLSFARQMVALGAR